MLFTNRKLSTLTNWKNSKILYTKFTNSILRNWSIRSSDLFEFYSFIYPDLYKDAAGEYFPSVLHFSNVYILQVYVIWLHHSTQVFPEASSFLFILRKIFFSAILNTIFRQIYLTLNFSEYKGILYANTISLFSLGSTISCFLVVKGSKRKICTDWGSVYEDLTTNFWLLT